MGAAQPPTEHSSTSIYPQDSRVLPPGYDEIAHCTSQDSASLEHPLGQHTMSSIGGVCTEWHNVIVHSSTCILFGERKGGREGMGGGRGLKKQWQLSVRKMIQCRICESTESLKCVTPVSKV